MVRRRLRRVESWRRAHVHTAPFACNVASELTRRRPQLLVTQLKRRSYRSSRCQFGLPRAAARRKARRARRRDHTKRRWRIIATKPRTTASTSLRGSTGDGPDRYPTSIQHPWPFGAVHGRPFRRPHAPDQRLPSARVSRSTPFDSSQAENAFDSRRPQLLPREIWRVRAHDPCRLTLQNPRGRAVGEESFQWRGDCIDPHEGRTSRVTRRRGRSP
jgi:hypothetical protein